MAQRDALKLAIENGCTPARGGLWVLVEVDARLFALDSRFKYLRAVLPLNPRIDEYRNVMFSPRSCFSVYDSSCIQTKLENKMKHPTLVTFATLIFLLLAGTASAGNSAYDSGYQAGYSDGLEDGYVKAYKRSYREGYRDGGNSYRSMHAEKSLSEKDYMRGYKAGYEDGYLKGSKKGDHHGYNDGYDQGRIDTLRDEMRKKMRRKHCYYPKHYNDYSRYR